MGDGVTDDKDLVLKFSGGGDYQAGGATGQLIVEDINLNGSRDNTEYAGIGNDTTQGLSYGNKTYSVSFTEHLNETAGEMVAEVMDDTTLSGTIRTPQREINVGKLDWNNFDLDAADDDSFQFSGDFNAREVENESV